MTKNCLLSLTLLAAAAGAQAAAVVGSSSLLTNTYANQLETWLGEGPITLTNLYTKQAGHTASNFHSAVDNKGRTFVVMYATEDTGNSAIIGGYNRGSWTSVNSYFYDFNLGDGNDNFVFNLSTSTKKTQTNQYSTYNDLSYGPTFGGGHDIYVNASLSLGYSYSWSYVGAGSSIGLSLVDGSGYNGANMRIAGLEVFTISSGVQDLPEPASLALLGVALAAAAAVRRRA